MSAMVSFRIDDTAALDEKAKAAGVTRSEFVRQLVAGLGESGGAWVVGYYSEPPAGIFPTEIEALRFSAQGFGQYVKFVPWGEWS